MLQKLLQAMRPPPDAVNQEIGRAAVSKEVPEEVDQDEQLEAMHRALVERQTALQARSRKLQEATVQENLQTNKFYNL